MTDKRIMTSVMNAAMALLLVLTAGMASAADRPGQVLKAEVVWTESDGLRHEIFTSSFHEGGWTEPEMITDDNADNVHPSIDIDSTGRKWVAWTAIEESGFEIRYAVFERGEWQQSQRLPSNLASNIKPSIIIDAADVPWLVWSGNNGGTDDIYWSRLMNGEWTDARQVNPPNEVPDIRPFLDLDEQQMPVVTWESYMNGGYVKLQSVWNGTDWSEPVEEPEQQEAPEETETSELQVTMPDFIKDTRQVFLRAVIEPPVAPTEPTEEQ